MFQSARETIVEDFVASLSDLIECYSGVTPDVVLDQNQDISQTNAAIVGFGDACCRGSAVLLASESVAAALSETTPLNPIDWLGELSNQLVGRLVNKISQYGILPQMGTPVTVSGRNLDLGAVSAEPIFWRVSWPDGSLYALLSLEVDENVELAFDPHAASAEEGSLNLF